MRLLMALAALGSATAASAVTPPTALEFIDRAIAESRMADARTLLSHAATAIDPGERRLREAEILLAEGALDAADRAFADAGADGPVAARALTGRGIVALRQGDTSAAAAHLEAAVAGDPRQARAWNALAVLADRRGDFARAEDAYGQALALAPDDAAIRSNRGWSRLLQGRAAEAEADLEAALAADPSLEAARTHLLLARALRGAYAEAFTVSSRDSLARDLNTVGFAAMMRGDVAIAEGYFARAQEHSGRHDAAIAANLAWLEAVRGQLADSGQARRQ